MSVLMPVPHCFNYCSFVVSFDIKKCESSGFVYVQYCFGNRDVSFFMFLVLGIL